MVHESTKTDVALDRQRFRWEQLVAVLGAVAAGLNWAWTNHQADLQEKQRTELAARVDATARTMKQIEMLPTIVGLLREARCDSDLAAVTLLREAAKFRGGDDGDFGRASARASLTLVKSRQESAQATRPPSTYCACDSLQLVTTLTDFGSDTELARIAAEISRMARAETGPCAAIPSSRQNLRTELDAAARGLTDEIYVVVLANDTSCPAAQASYRRLEAALAAELGAQFDRSLLRLRAGMDRWERYLVVTYGRFTLDGAGDLITRVRGRSGLPPDIYWGRTTRYRDQSACMP